VRLLFFTTVTFVLEKSVSIVLILAMWTATAQAQADTPSPNAARPHVELEVKPPDEPQSQSTADIEVAPDAVPSSSATEPPAQSGDDSDAPISADRVAHPPEIATYVVPEYPRIARAKRIEGRVLLMVIVDESGKVEDNVTILDSIPMLDQAAIDAIHQWSFTPGRDADGDPVRVRLKVPIRFTLR